MTTEKSDYDEILKDIHRYRLKSPSFDFDHAIKIIESHNWTHEEFYAEFRERQTFLKLQGQI